MTDPREERLPKWAREEIARLRRLATDMEHLAEQRLLATKPEECNTILDPYGLEVGLGVNPSVRFKLGGDRLRDYIDVRGTSDGSLRVMGGDMLSILPSAGNVVYVKLAS